MAKFCVVRRVSYVVAVVVVRMELLGKIHNSDVSCAGCRKASWYPTPTAHCLQMKVEAEFKDLGPPIPCPRHR